jgi:hypothetical protein
MTFYWTRHPDGPFVTLIGVAATYLHPEANQPEELRSRARLAAEDDEEMRTFKAELREAILHPERLPGGELISNVQPDYRDPGIFLERLWWYLYRDEPVTAPGTPGASRQPARPVHGGTESAPPRQGDAAVTPARHDPVRTTTETDSVFECLIIPAGAEGTVLETMPDGSCLAELQLLPPTGEDDVDDYRQAMLAEGNFPQVVLTEGEYEIIQAHGRE